MADTMYRIAKGILACSCLLLLYMPKAMASEFTMATQQKVLGKFHLNKPYHVEHVVIQNEHVYILVTTTEKQKTTLHLYLARSHRDEWLPAGGSALGVTDKPWRSLFHRNRADLEYLMSSITGYREDGETEFSFDWCIYGYTTDPNVTSFRMKTKLGYIPLATIHGRYFMRVLTSVEHENFMEVQGLNSKGEVVQTDDGVGLGKPRQWSPKHSELY